MQTLLKLRLLLQGKKTYIIAAMAAVVWYFQIVGWLDPETAARALEFLLTIGGITLAAKINRTI